MIETLKQALDALEAQGLNVDGSAQLAVRAKYGLRQAIAELESQAQGEEHMNERIKELMIQSDYPAPEIALRAQKLAELIVQECQQACINLGNSYEIKSVGQYQAELFAFAIKQHFGVTE